MVHLDVKADNICIPVGPEGFDRTDPGAVMRPCFEDLALIDFAFSLVSGEELDEALPIAGHTEYDYQSPRLFNALEAGRKGDLAPTAQLGSRRSSGDQLDALAAGAGAHPGSAIARGARCGPAGAEPAPGLARTDEASAGGRRAVGFAEARLDVGCRKCSVAVRAGHAADPHGHACHGQLAAQRVRVGCPSSLGCSGARSSPPQRVGARMGHRGRHRRPLAGDLVVGDAAATGH
jgi:hypothetical protein